MISIYIVDDEPMAVRYLEILLEAIGRSSEIIGSETNSLRALSDIRKMNPDIVFSDISMPVMDGLELAEKVMQSCSSRVFLLTSYEDFEYAKRGVRIGVEDYLLKNELSESMLKEILDRVEKDIETQKRNRHKLLAYNMSLFLSGQSMEEDRIYSSRTNQRYALLTFYKVPALHLYGEQKDPMPQPDTFRIQEMPWPEGIRCSAFIQMGEREYCAVIFISETVVDSSRRLMYAADRVLSELDAAGQSWKCICSDVRLHFSDLQDLYRENHVRCGYLYAMVEKSLFSVHEILLRESAENQIIGILREIGNRMAASDPEAAAQVEQLLICCKEHDTEAVYQEHIRNFYQFMREAVLRDDLDVGILDIADTYINVNDLERAIVNMTALYMEKRSRKEERGRHYSEYVLLALGFIEKNYARDISVAEIAEEAHVSEGHLRRLFKQELDMSVIDYLTDYRIRRAKLLLNAPAVRYSDVWKETGFSSARYFGYVFRKKEGMSPKEYRYRQMSGSAAVVDEDE